MKKLEIVKYYQTIIECEQFLVTGSLALNLMGFNCPVKDIDIRIVNPSESSIAILKSLEKAYVPLKLPLYPNENIVRFIHEGINIDFFIEKEKVKTSIITKDNIEIVPLDSIVKAKKSMNRIKDIIQLRSLAKEILTNEEMVKFMDNYIG